MKTRALLIPLLTVLLGTATSQATLLYDVTFTGDTPNTSPPETTSPIAGATTTHPYNVSPATGDADLHVWVRNTGYPTVGDGTVVELWDSVTSTTGTNQASIRFQLNNADKVTTTSANKIATFTWDMLVSHDNGTGNLFMNFRGDAGTITQVIWGSNGTNLVFGGNTYTYSIDTSYSYKFELNYATATMKLWVNDVFQGESAFDSSKDFTYVQLATASTGRGQVALDNFKIETSIPEPASMALLGLGGCIMLLQHRR